MIIKNVSYNQPDKFYDYSREYKCLTSSLLTANLSFVECFVRFLSICNA